MRRNTSVGLSPLVAVILLIAITVAAAVVVSGVFFNLASIAGRRPAALIDQARLVTDVTGNGLWVVVVKNTGDVPITGVNIADNNGNCVPDSMDFEPDSVNPGGTTAGSDSVTDCTVGGNYRFTVIVEFEDGSQQRLAVSATAGLA
jgi:flagellin-like protein